MADWLAFAICSFILCKSRIVLRTPCTENGGRFPEPTPANARIFRPSAPYLSSQTGGESRQSMMSSLHISYNHQGTECRSRYILQHGSLSTCAMARPRMFSARLGSARLGSSEHGHQPATRPSTAIPLHTIISGDQIKNHCFKGIVCRQQPYAASPAWNCKPPRGLEYNRVRTTHYFCRLYGQGRVFQFNRRLSWLP